MAELRLFIQENTNQRHENYELSIKDSLNLEESDYQPESELLNKGNKRVSQEYENVSYNDKQSFSNTKSITLKAESFDQSES